MFLLSNPLEYDKLFMDKMFLCIFSTRYWVWYIGGSQEILDGCMDIWMRNCFIYFPELFWELSEITYVISAVEYVVQRGLWVSLSSPLTTVSHPLCTWRFSQISSNFSRKCPWLHSSLIFFLNFHCTQNLSY